jgi:hypothetical protein
VSTPDFLFALRFAGQDQVGPILSDVAANVFQQVGCAPDAVAELVRDLSRAVLRGTDRGEHVVVQFRAEAGLCEVIVRVDDREIWRTSRRMP